MKSMGRTTGHALALCAASVCGGGAAAAADFATPATAVPSMIDVAFGVAGVTDYRFRGVTNSNKDPAIHGYAELQAFDWLYAGAWASSVRFPSPFELTDPALEIDFYGGVRRTWQAFTLDVGGIYYDYPGENTKRTGPDLREIDYWEIYAKPALAIGDFASIAANVFWSSDFANVGSDALYVSVVPKISIPVAATPSVGFYVSGELGKQWLKKTSALPVEIDWKDYVAWNAGGGMTYKAMTLDVRYSDTSLTRCECAFNYGVRGWCGGAVVGKLSFDTALSALK